jgi:thioredoxin-like negative regulator of GroEL
MTTVTDATFGQATGAPLAIVDFWSPSCPYCMQFKPVFEEVAAQMGGQIFMATAHTGEAPQSAAAYRISSIPAVIFLANGKEVHRVEGAMTKADFLNEIDRVLVAQEGRGDPLGTAAPESTVASALNFLLAGGILVGGVYLAAEYLAD